MKALAIAMVLLAPPCFAGGDTPSDPLLDYRTISHTHGLYGEMPLERLGRAIPESYFTKKSSNFAPPAIATFNHLGRFPRPDHTPPLPSAYLVDLIPTVVLAARS